VVSHQQSPDEIREAGCHGPHAQPARETVTGQQRHASQNQGEAHEAEGEAVEPVLHPTHGLGGGERRGLAVRRRGRPAIHGALQRDPVDHLENAIGGRRNDRRGRGQPRPRGLNRRAVTQALVQRNQAAEEHQGAGQSAEVNRRPVAGSGVFGEHPRIVVGVLPSRV
jgi:hypothetical protein